MSGSIKSFLLVSVLGYAATVTALPFKGRVVHRATSLRSSYDYVVVGGGTAGLVVADRLSEDSSTTVLVIEAGQLDQGESYITIPGLGGGAVGTKYDWNLTYVATDDVNGNAISIAQGKVVGGSSLLNRMSFNRASQADYNRYDDLGIVGWDWNALLPYFEKSENFTAPSQSQAEEWNITYTASLHGTNGPIHSSYSPWFWPATKIFIEAMEELDVYVVPDGASGHVGGFYVTHAQNPTTVTRSDARTGYYDPVVERPNLTLLTGHQVTKLLTNNTSGTPQVTGVEFATSSSAARSTVGVNQEAIVSAGAIHTPQILQLSGIGDSTELAKWNITTVADVPGVGQNFQDHVLLVLEYSIDYPEIVSDLSTNATFASEQMALYKSNLTGAYSTGLGDFLVFLPTSNYTNNATSIYNTALTQLTSQYLDDDTPVTVKTGYATQHALLTQGVKATDQATLEVMWIDGIIYLALLHPFSRGSVKLASTDPFEAPLANPAFLSNPVDLQILVEGVKYTRKVFQTDALSAVSPAEVLPGTSIASDAEIENWIRSNAGTVWHPLGSSKVGMLADGAVVDDNFKVYGVQNLRVVDASVVPMSIGAHNQATVYALAEKAADAIKC